MNKQTIKFFYINGLKFFIILVFILLNNSILAQYYPNSFYRNIQIDTAKANFLEFRIENSNFLKNDEYFNDIVQGYTLIGYFINPKLVYYPTKNARIEAGIHFLKYSGIENFTKVLPTFSFHYQAGKFVEIVIGTLNGTANHEIIAPVFNSEYFFTDNVENGLQFLFDTKFYKGDIWINWQQFIFKGDKIQEMFTTGISNRFFVNGQNKLHSFSIPLQILFEHHGGQINETSNSVITFNNSAIGINYSYNPVNSFVKKASVEFSYVSFKDQSTVHLLPYIQGYGLYSSATVKASYFNLNVAHWFGDFYLSGRGDPIYQSASTIYQGYYEPQRALITSRLMFEKSIIKGLDIGAGFESYFDLYNFYIDYWYMFYINFNRDFFIKKFK